MKFLPLFATAVMAGTATLQARQVSVITDALSAIQSQTSALDEAVNAFQGADQAGPLQSQAASLVSLIQSSTSSVNGIGPLTSQEALSLTGPLGTLASAVDSSVNDLIAKKDAFSSAGVGSVVYSTLVQLQTAAQSFTTAALSKVPEGLQGAGQSLAAPIAASLTKGVNAFQEFANGGGSTPTTTTSSGGSAPTTTSGNGGAYPTSAAPTTTAPGNSYPPSSTTGAPTTTSKVPVYTGAANKAATGFGAAAAAAIAVAALV